MVLMLVAMVAVIFHIRGVYYKMTGYNIFPKDYDRTLVMVRRLSTVSTVLTPEYRLWILWLQIPGF
jgi:hypothetical protein